MDHPKKTQTNTRANLTEMVYPLGILLLQAQFYSVEKCQAIYCDQRELKGYEKIAHYDDL
jgi:hypothetical protein